MRASEILELVRAGYTKEEIAALDGENNAETPTGNPEQENGTSGSGGPKKAAQEPAKEESETKTQETAKESETEKLVKALGLKFDSLTAAIQSQNAKTIEQSGDNNMTAEDVIANIINPNGGK